MNAFEREDRYLVAKKSDISAALTEKEMGELQVLMQKVQEHRCDQGKQPLECVVVESDWPMYAATWDDIQRMSENKVLRMEEVVHFLEKQALPSLILSMDDYPLSPGARMTVKDCERLIQLIRD